MLIVASFNFKTGKELNEFHFGANDMIQWKVNTIYKNIEQYFTIHLKIYLKTCFI